MHAVLLAAGQSSRLYPFTNGVHKSMIKILGKPLLEHTILGLAKSGIKQIVIVVDKNSSIPDYFGNGNSYGVEITYVFQIQALGMGNALLLAEEYIKGDFFLLNAHHVDVVEFVQNMLSAFKKSDAEGVLLAEEREATWKYGVLKIIDKKVEEIIEKPRSGSEPSKLCVVGIYLFRKALLQTLRETPKDHYQLEMAISQFAKIHDVIAVKATRKTVTLKYPWDLLEVKNYLLGGIKKSIGKDVKIAKSAEIIGEVVVSDNVTIMEGARIKGPCYFGKNAYIGTNVILRNGVDIGENCVIGANMEVKNSLIMQGTTTHSGFIGDSIIGENSKIAAQFCSANVRLDRKTIQVIVKGEAIDTGDKSLGAIIGTKSNIGIKVSTMPGIIIGNNVVVGPSTVVKNNVSDNTTYYTKFQEIISRK